MFTFKETRNEKFYYNKLFYDFIFNYKKLEDHYFYDFHKEEDYLKRVSDIELSYQNSLRKDILKILEDTNKKAGCSTETLENIKKLSGKDTYVVIGGQQPGFFSGPIFIIYKILSIIRLSSEITNNFGIKTIPVFWNASDDSNFDSINSFGVFNRDLKEVRLDQEGAGPDIDKKRFSDIFFPEIFYQEKLKELIENLRPTEFSAGISHFIKECLDISKIANTCSEKVINPAQLFSTIILKMFSKYGLVILDPSSAEFRKLASGFMAIDLENSGLFNREINSSGERLIKDGYHAQIQKVLDQLNFFITEKGIRHKVMKAEKGYFSFARKKYSEKDIKDLISSDYLRFAPGVSLRPLIQDNLLPVLATLCGPGEVSYFAQLKSAYNIVGKKTAIIYPRFTATIIENSIKRSMKRADVHFEDLGLDRESMLRRAISVSVENNAEILIDNFSSDVLKKIHDLKNEVISKDRDLISVFSRIEKNFEKEVSVLRKKILSEYKKKNLLFSSDLDKIYLNVFPNGKLQERTISVFNYVNNHGFYFIDFLCDKIDILDNSHKFLIFD